MIKNALSKQEPLEHLKRFIIEKCKLVEQKSPFRWGPLHEMRCLRYPFERNLSEYKMVLKDLDSEIQKLSTKSFVLDLGAGKGIAIAEIEQTTGCNIVATGIKIPSDAVCSFTIAVASNLPFDDNHFDLVISFNSISWEPDQMTALREVQRILKPGSVALVYLMSFSYCVWLWFGENFWNECNLPSDFCKAHEFSYDKKDQLENIDVIPVQLHEPTEKYKEGYYLVLHG